MRGVTDLSQHDACLRGYTHTHRHAHTYTQTDTRTSRNKDLGQNKYTRTSENKRTLIALYSACLRSVSGAWRRERPLRYRQSNMNTHTLTLMSSIFTSLRARVDRICVCMFARTCACVCVCDLCAHILSVFHACNDHSYGVKGTQTRV